MSKIPAELRYSKDHEWVRVEGDVVYVGITDYAQDSLGEVVYVELPPTGEQYAANEEIANIESVKAASAIYNPVAGTVDSVNDELDGSPELINEDPYPPISILADWILSEIDLVARCAATEFPQPRLIYRIFKILHISCYLFHGFFIILYVFQNSMIDGGTMKRIVFLMILLCATAGSLFAAFTFEPFVETEQGTIAILHHTYKNTETSTNTDPTTTFDFRTQGGQDVLYPFERYAVGATINGRHRAWFTYQPLNLVTT